MKDNTEQTQEADAQEAGTTPGAGVEDVQPVADSTSTDSQPTNAYEEGLKQVFGELNPEDMVKKIQNLNSLVGDQPVAQARKKAATYDHLIERAATEQGISKDEIEARIQEALTVAEQPAPQAQTQAQPTAQPVAQPTGQANTGDALLRKQVKDLTRANQATELLKRYPEAEQVLETVKGDWELSGVDMTEIFEKKYKPLIDLGSKNAGEVEKEKEEQVQPSSKRIENPDTKPNPRNWQEALSQRVTDKFFGDEK